MHYVTAAEAMQLIQNDQRIFIHSAACAPQLLIDALVERHAELRNIELCHMLTLSTAPYAEEKYKESFRLNNIFVSSSIRPYINSNNCQYIPVFLSEAPVLFRRKILPIDVAFIHVSPPDEHGYCSLGVSIDCSRAAVDVANVIIAQVNPNMPRSLGDSMIHKSRINAAIWTEVPVFEYDFGAPNAEETAIGRHIAELVEDGSCLQVGFGGIPNAALNSLHNHKNLGIHTEMFSDGLLPLVEKGVVNGSNKKIGKGKIISSFAIGTRKVYDFIDNNPLVNMLDVSYVNDTSVIRQNPKAISINSAIEIDLTGQVCADSIGSNIYSGVGGQMDFVRGASLSEGGKPIIAMQSATGKGISKIVPMLREGAGVVTSRAHVQYVITEYGTAYLYGKNLAQRAKALINIAHPDHREALEKSAYELYGRSW